MMRRACAGIDLTPDPLDWTNINGAGPKAGNTQTIGGLSQGRSIGLVVSWTVLDDLAAISYSKNAAGLVSLSQLDSISVTNGDTIRFTIQDIVVSSGTASGMVTIKNSTNGATIDAFNYAVTG